VSSVAGFGTEGSPAAARAIIEANAYMTLATADEAGMPWASPVWFAHDNHAAFLWVSRPDARHSRNIAVRPEVGIVIFDSTVPVGGAQAVYVEGAARALGEAELERMIAVYSARSELQGGPAWTAQDVTGHAAHRLYVARAVTHFLLADGDRRLGLAMD
jgi:nitroimidazol reductase NimA-like FMN-containing flavoprotein (pyridoxamine 5'-phosphate oxidase superfamily)